MNIDGGTLRYNLEVNGAQEFKTSLEEVSAEFDRLTDRLEDIDLSKLGSKGRQEISDTVDNIIHLQKVLESTEAGTEEYDRALISANEQLKYFAELLGESGDAAEQAVSPLQGFASALGQIAGQAGLSALKGVATGATTALVGLAKKGISATNFLETSQIGMAGLIGSFEGGTKALSVAADFWQNNPFQRFDVTNATKQLVQYGRTVDQLSGDLKILGNVSLSTGVGIDELAIRYGRVASSGRAMTQDLEMMSMRGVPIYRELQKILGGTQDEIRKLASEGKIGFAEFKQAMEGAVNEEAMQAYEKTLARQTDRLKGSIQILAGDLAGYKIVNDELQISANGLYETWTKLINTLATGLRTSKLRDGLTKIGEALANALDKIFKFYEVWDEEQQKMVQHSATLEKVFDVLGKAVDFLGEHAELLIPIALTGLSVVSRLVANVPILGTAFTSLTGPIGKIFNLLAGLGQTSKVALIGIIGLVAALVTVYKNSEDFRKQVGNLIKSLGDIIKNLLPVVRAFFQAFVDFASSTVVTFTLSVLVALLADIAKWLASIPTEVLSVIVGLIVGLKMSNLSPWVYWVTVVSLAYSWLKKIINEAGGLHKVLQDIGTAIRNFFTKIWEYISSFSLENIGTNFIAGFFEGANQALADGKSGLMAGFQGIINGVKKVFGIASPSKVMYGIGQNLGIGLAEGITSTSDVTQKAMNNLATATLKQAEKVIGNMKDFGLIDANATYKQWKKVANIFTIGSQQYEQAIEKMEDARKQVNLEIIKLQNAYNDTLDSTIKKIQNAYGLFDDVTEKTKKNSKQIIKNLDKQVAKTEEWAEAQRLIDKLDLAEGLKEELKSLGVESTAELSAVANMTTSELENLNELWLKKQSTATTAATEQLSDYKDDVLKEIKKLADGIDGETVKVEDVGGRLVSSISEGITGALPTLESSFAQLEDYIKEAKQELAKTASGDNYGLGGGDEGGDDDKDKKNPEDAAKDFGESLGGIAATAFGGMVLVKLGKKILPKIGSKIGGALSDKGGLLGKLGNLLSGKGGASKVAEVAESAQTTENLSGLTNATSQIGETSKGLSKANEWLKTITKGAAAIAAIAIAIAAIAGAIWVMDNALRDIDWGTFLSKLGMVAVTTVVMGVLSAAMGKVAEKLGMDLLWGILAIVGIAGEIALLGLALGLMANSIPDDVGNVQLKMLLMYEAIIVMGVLTALIGALMMTGVGAGAIGLGLLAIAGIAGDIALVGLALGAMANAIPDDVGLVQMKLLLVYEAVAAFEVLTGVAGVLALVEGLGILVILGIADEIKQVAIALMVMYYAIPDDILGVQIKLDYLKSVIGQMSEANFGNVFGNLIQSARIAALEPVIGEFIKIASSLKLLQDINVNENDIFGIMGAIRAIMESGDVLASYAELGKSMAFSIAQGMRVGNDEIKNAATEVQSTFWHTLQAKIKDEYYQGKAFGESLRQGMYDVDYANAGWWAVQGFINGANTRAYKSDGVYHTGWWIAENFLQGLEDRGEQGSPWKTTMQSGKWAVEGLIDGMESMESQVINEAETLADGIVNALDLSDTTMSPELSVRSKLTPGLFDNNGTSYTGGGIVINQTNNNYSEYDEEQSLRNLSWELSKI